MPSSNVRTTRSSQAGNQTYGPQPRLRAANARIGSVAAVESHSLLTIVADRLTMIETWCDALFLAHASARFDPWMPFFLITSSNQRIRRPSPTNSVDLALYTLLLHEGRAASPGQASRSQDSIRPCLRRADEFVRRLVHLRQPILNLRADRCRDECAS